MTRVKGPFTPEKVDRVYYYTPTTLDANGTRWTKDARKQFNITLPDAVLERLGAALGLNVSFSHVEVVLTGDALEDSQAYDVIGPRSKDVDAYIILAESSNDVVEARRRFSAHDQKAVSRHFHAAKWAMRNGEVDRRCEFDVLQKAFDATVRAEVSLASVNWSDSEWVLLAEFELRSLKPTIYVVNVSREEYTRQELASVADTYEWLYELQVGGRKSPVILTNIQLEEELAERKSSFGENVASVYDGILGEAFRYLQLTRFYVLHENEIQAWYIPVSRLNRTPFRNDPLPTLRIELPPILSSPY
ncbi:GTP-binding protein [Aphelenchoides avenae]|nr:GTP-binding protein [Aphelenchus avenae]